MASIAHELDSLEHLGRREQRRTYFSSRDEHMFETEMNIFSEKNICWDQRRAVFSWAAFFPFFPMQTLSNDAEERAAVLRAHDLFIAARDGAEPPASTEEAQPKRWKMEGRGFMLTCYRWKQLRWTQLRWKKNFVVSNRFDGK